MLFVQGSMRRCHVIGVAVAVLALSGIGAADTICVPDDYTTIQEAIDAAQPAARHEVADRIWVASEGMRPSLDVFSRISNCVDDTTTMSGDPGLHFVVALARPPPGFRGWMQSLLPGRETIEDGPLEHPDLVERALRIVEDAMVLRAAKHDGKLIELHCAGDAELRREVESLLEHESGLDVAPERRPTDTDTSETNT